MHTQTPISQQLMCYRYGHCINAESRMVDVWSPIEKYEGMAITISRYNVSAHIQSRWVPRMMETVDI